METKRKIKTHQDLEVYRVAFDASMTIFELSKGFPPEERYSLTDQFRRSSRSVCAPGGVLIEIVEADPLPAASWLRHVHSEDE